MQYTIHVNAVDRDITVDWDSMPETAREFVIQYGLRQKLNDCHVSGETPDEKNAAVDKTVAALMSGDIRVGAARAGDPVSAEAKRLARGLATERFRKDGKAKKGFAETDEFKALVATYANHPKVRAQAESNVASAKALTDL